MAWRPTGSGAGAVRALTTTRVVSYLNVGRKGTTVMASIGESVGLREANQHFSELVERVARTGRGVLVTKRGVPVVRILPVEPGDGALTAEQTALLDRVLGQKLPLQPWRFARDSLHER